MPAYITAYVAVRRSLSTTYTAVVLGLLLRQYVSYQFGVWAALSDIPEAADAMGDTSSDAVSNSAENDD